MGSARPGSVSAATHRPASSLIDALVAGDRGLFTGALYHLVLPALVLAAFNIGLLTRYTRSAVLEVLERLHPRCAGRRVRRSASSSSGTSCALPCRRRDGHRARLRERAHRRDPVEHIFGWPGMGQYAYQSATTLDLPAIMGDEHVRRGRLRHDQLRRRRPARRYRPRIRLTMSAGRERRRARRRRGATGLRPAGLAPAARAGRHRDRRSSWLSSRSSPR